MARISFTTGFGAGLGVLFAILLFPFIVIGGCLLTIGSCGVAAVSLLPKSDRTSTPTPLSTPPALAAAADRAAPRYKIVKSEIKDDSYYPVYYVENPTKTDIAKLASEIKSEHSSTKFILAEFYDNEGCVDQQAARYLHDYSDYSRPGRYIAQAKSDILTFRKDIPLGNGSVSDEAAQWLRDSSTLEDAQPDPTEKAAKKRTEEREKVEKEKIAKAREESERSWKEYQALQPTIRQWREKSARENQVAVERAAREKRENLESLAREKGEREAIEKAERDEVQYRTWTSANGKYTTEAKLLSYANGTITIETHEGKTTKAPLEKLSAADQDFVTKWRRLR